ncbi:MAG: hypothetical protein A2268_16690 [Candidatus Raymondbacteria bacterium RifOxyA12_full_50_37]|uniref:Outer-membrane lipoprotein carrier protein n=1 Tax=Candidatus Raymondbacteria bacterium RIFOXYD12_FULL_49_13 TaxID=1817890 RepID=A0A1F7F464_UNCRA|nr:MAG: hypothetical protein A2268_16690 [Candidatus Raymondbacteria bacterium RifOxyA12_full_50_37]OGJ86248.1 MAG: hypothetical protein A2248_16280 [Candidatus Raymondbacteria bacterium RIFOXYA2_FULL_49_16]OGJ95786.1 MAG: hypothetical protein A2453_11600 [Candidatus Raymondbacteria bacterium RIFOXYC2_FULL_50_21]OGK01454.1 MAG: hypothetical protein A2519_19200 [Candidatus Raymondbacteria bacterium RIFOXYD12_FULL_49_13]OGK03939.1 MAG: hypothetical protein A2487_12115 [Candidatus Raymondbacteria 
MHQGCRARILSAAFIYYLFSHGAWAQSPDSVIAKTEKTIAGAKSLTAEFSLEIRWKLRETVEKKKGKLFLQKPGKYRIELDSSMYVTDGETFWRYSPKNRQLVINDILDVQNDFQPGEWLFSYSAYYSPVAMETAVLAGEKCFTIRMAPKDKARFTSLTAWISEKTGLPLKLETIDKNENNATYLISSMAVGPGLPGALFTITPPKGTEVIDMRE